MKRWILPVLLVIFTLAFLVSAWLLVDYWMDSCQQKNDFHKLAQIMEQSAVSKTDLQPNVELPEEEIGPTEPVLATVTDPDTGETVSLLPEFAQLYTMNNHIVGWISIADTDINYPVMQTPDSRDYYLYKGFDRVYSRHGCIYVREECDVFAPSDNITIYGHRMGDGTMFNDLHDYADPDFYEDHRYILFNTLTERHTYEIAYIFRISSTVGYPFQFQEFTDAANEAEFNAFIENCRDYALYDTGVTPAYTDKLITLATCEYTRTNGRLVVVARRIQ